MTNGSTPRDHLANERTYLAWVRTSIGIMAFGFVVEKFALFMREVALILAKEPVPFHAPSPEMQGYSSIFGIFLVALGTLIGLFSYVKFKIVQKQIENDTYRPSKALNVLLVLSVLFIGVFLIVYLSNSVKL